MWQPIGVMCVLKKKTLCTKQFTMTSGGEVTMAENYGWDFNGWDIIDEVKEKTEAKTMTYLRIK